MPQALVRPPSHRLAEGELTHAERRPVDVDLARRQWDGYVTLLADAGFDPVVLPAAEAHPDGVFVEDAVVVLPDLRPSPSGRASAGPTALLTAPGTSSRVGEVASVRAAVERLGLTSASVEGPGTLEGGDVLKVASTVYVGLSSRTNADGVAQLAAVAEPLGHTVVAVPVTRVLHLKSAVTALPDGTVIGHPPHVDDPSSFAGTGGFLPVPEPEGTAVVVLAPDRVLMSAAAPRTAELLRQRGLDVVTTAVSEFEKLEGCVTCLSVRLR